MDNYVVFPWAVLLVLSDVWGVKVWTPSTSLDDPSNWGSDNQPHTCDRLLMNSAQDITIQMPLTEKFKMKSIVFPREGVFTFPKKASLNFAGIQACTSNIGKDVQFLPHLVRGWLDPDNWNSTSQEGWVPHSARVPCAGETVVFPPGKSTSVMLPPILVPMGPISFKGVTMDPARWSNFLNSEEGYESFKGTPDMRQTEWLADTGCLNAKTCFCTRHTYAIKDWTIREVDSSVYYEAVCMYAKPRCPSFEKSACYSPVYPEGHCCGVCGAIVNIHDTTVYGIRLSSVKSVVTAVVQEYGSKVEFYVGRRSNGGTQIVLLSTDGDPAESLTLARTISSQLQSENLGTLEALSYSGFSKNSDRKSLAFSIVFGTLIGILTFFASVYYIFMILPKNKWNPFQKKDPFTFARFRNTIPEAVSTETLVIETERPTSDSFANPLYEQGGAVAMNTISNKSDEENGKSKPSEKSDQEKQALVVLDDDSNEELQNKVDVEEDSSDSEGSVDSFSQIRERVLPETENSDATNP